MRRFLVSALVSLACGVLCLGFLSGFVPVARAAGLQIELYIGSALAAHRTVAVGGTNSGFNAVVSGGAASSFTWSIASGGENFMSVSSSGNTASITGLAEGVTKLQVSIPDGSGGTVSDYCWITVYSSVTPTDNAVVKAGAKTYFATTTTAKPRGTVSSPETVRVDQVSGDWFHVTFRDGFDFTEDSNPSHNAYVQGADISIPVNSVVLDRSSVSVGEGRATTLSVSSLVPSYANTNKNVSWSSADTSIATVNSLGVVTGKQHGKSTAITARVGGVQATAKVTVTEILPTNITITPSLVSVVSGKTVQLKSSITPVDTTKPRVSWSSSNSKIAAVNSSGVVTGKKVGKSTTVTATVGKVSTSVKVTVVDSIQVVEKPRTVPKIPSTSAPSDHVAVSVHEMGVDYVKIKIMTKGAARFGFESSTGMARVEKCTVTKCIVRVLANAIVKPGSKLRVVAEAGNNEDVSIGSAEITPILAQPSVTVKEITQSQSAGSAVKVAWSKVGGVSGFDVFRCDITGGNCAKVKTVSSFKAGSYIDVNAGLGESYTYKVVPFITSGGKKTSFEKAAGGSQVSTFLTAKAQSKGRAQAKSELRGLLGSRLLLKSNGATSKSPVRGKLTRDKSEPISDLYPFAKFIWTGKKNKELEVHLFVNFVDKSQQNASGEDLSFIEHREHFLQGLKKFYGGVLVTSQLGDWNNENVYFKTKLVMHTTVGEPVATFGQRYLQVEIGGDESPSVVTSSDSKFGLGTGTTIKMPSLHRASGDVKEIPGLAAHEVGHALGLADAYVSVPVSKNGKKTTDVMVENGETTGSTSKTLKSGLKSGAGWVNLMKNPFDAKSITGNDLEMILNHYDIVLRGRLSNVNRKEFYDAFDDGFSNQISEVIKDTADKVKSEK